MLEGWGDVPDRDHLPDPAVGQHDRAVIRSGRRHDGVEGALRQGRLRAGLAGRGGEGAQQRKIAFEAVAQGVGRRRVAACGFRGVGGIGRRVRLSHAAILARVSSALTDEERLLQATAREFAQREVAPGAIERDEAERYDRSLFTAMGALGLTAAPFPAAVGGAGFSYLGWTLVMEELGAADMAMAVSLSVHILSQYPVVTWGTDEQRARWLPAMQAGEALGAFALTEPHAGSDAAAIRTRAERVGPSTRRVLPADRDEDLDLQRPGGRPVPRVCDGGSGRRACRDHGLPRREGHAAGSGSGRTSGRWGSGRCPAAELVFEGCEVPAANRLGAEGDGYRIALSALGEGRISIAAACVGLARAGLEAAARLPGGASGVRRAAVGPAGAAVHAGRDGPGRGGGAGTHPGSRDGQGSRRAPGGGLVTRQVDGVRHGDAGRDRRGPAVRRDAATRARPAWSA